MVGAVLSSTVTLMVVTVVKAHASEAIRLNWFWPILKVNVVFGPEITPVTSTDPNGG